MRVLVTGGTGYLGKELVPALMKKHDAVVFTRRNMRAEFETFRGNISNRDDVIGAVSDVDAIIHMAVESRHYAPWKRHLQTTIKGTENIIEAAAKKGTKVVYLSSTAVFARNKTRYTVAKSLAENIVCNKQGDINTTIIRPSSIYDLERILAAKKLAGKPLPSLNTLIQPTFRTSLVSSIISALNEKNSETYTIVDESPIKFQNFIDACTYPGKPIYLPHFLVFPAMLFSRARFFLEDKVFENNSSELGIPPVDTLKTIRSLTSHKN